MQEVLYASIRLTSKTKQITTETPEQIFKPLLDGLPVAIMVTAI